MRTKIITMATIKNRMTKIGDLFFYKGKYESYIDAITAGQEGAYLQVTVHKEDGTIMTDIFENELEEYFFWEKAIIYQLPDTEGNLSEVKIGQEVWIQNKQTNNIEECAISKFYGNNIEVMSIVDGGFVFISNIKGLTHTGRVATTNKPSRFHGKQDWSHAPENAVAWAIDEVGRAYWYLEIPTISNCGDFRARNSFAESAGYRNDLIDDRKKMEATDWKKSLVMRPNNN